MRAYIRCLRLVTCLRSDESASSILILHTTLPARVVSIRQFCYFCSDTLQHRLDLIPPAIAPVCFVSAVPHGELTIRQVFFYTHQEQFPVGRFPFALGSGLPNL